MAEFTAAHAPRLLLPLGSATAGDDGPPPGPLPKPPDHAHRPTYFHPNPITIFPEPPAEKNKKKKKTAKPKRRRYSCCFLCCVWSLIALLVILTLLALCAALIHARFHLKLPEFGVDKLGATWFNVSEAEEHVVLDVGFDVEITMWNRNDAVRLENGGMKVGLFAGGDVRVGKGSAPGFRQEEKNMTVVAVKTRVAGMAVYGTVGNALERRYKNETLEVDLSHASFIPDDIFPSSTTVSKPYQPEDAERTAAVVQSEKSTKGSISAAIEPFHHVDLSLRCLISRHIYHPIDPKSPTSCAPSAMAHGRLGWREMSPESFLLRRAAPLLSCPPYDGDRHTSHRRRWRRRRGHVSEKGEGELLRDEKESGDHLSLSNFFLFFVFFHSEHD